MAQTTLTEKILADRSGFHRSNAKTTRSDNEPRAPSRTPQEIFPSNPSIDAGSTRLLHRDDGPGAAIYVENSPQARSLAAVLYGALERSPDLAMMAHRGITRSMTEAALATVTS